MTLTQKINYFVGSNLSVLKHTVLSSSFFPLIRYYPRGDSWLYDAQRFADTRDFRVVFDVGANIGQTAWDLTRYCKSASIYCFEPVSNSFDKLSNSYGKHKNVTCIKKALGSYVGETMVELHSDSELNTLVPDQPRKTDLTGELELIEIDTIDEFCDTHKVHLIDLLKMDVQGWELEVLKGAINMIRSQKVRFIYAEVNFRKKISDMQYFEELNNFMQNHGYILCGFYDGFRYGENKKFLSFSNVLYINPDFIETSITLTD